MRFLFTLASLATMLAVVVFDQPALAESVGNDPGLARFEGRVINLAEDWEEADACALWDVVRGAECFRNEWDMVDFLQQIGMTGGALAPNLGAAATCSSSLKLYDGYSHTGTTFYVYTTNTWINLADYGWTDRTSSYRVGACDSYFADHSDGGGEWYPTSLTEAWDTASSMTSGWNNRISSVYMS